MIFRVNYIKYPPHLLTNDKSTWKTPKNDSSVDLMIMFGIKPILGLGNNSSKWSFIKIFINLSYECILKVNGVCNMVFGFYVRVCARVA